MVALLLSTNPKIEIINGDCMEFMASCGRFDLAIVDPPYGVKQNAFRSKSRTKLAKTTDFGSFTETWDKSCPDENYFDTLFRISTNQIIWGANHMMHVIKRKSPCWIVWDKDNSGCFADCELAFTSFQSAARIFTYRWNGMIQQNMKEKEVRIHPTQKPVKLYEWLLINYAKQGQTILDTHMGSGSSAIAAYNLGFDFTGIELSKEYFDKAVRRIEEHISQGRLFGPQMVQNSVGYLFEEVV